MGVYRSVVAPALFRTDPEWIHDRTIRTAELAGRVPGVCGALKGLYGRTDPSLVMDVAGLRMATPIGLGAGFDKNARAVKVLGALGFGHVEVGSIAAERSEGNPRPRLFRVAEERAIVVHYGVPNDGAQRVRGRLAEPRDVPVGVNVVNTNRGIDAPPAEEEELIGDYARSVSALQSRADYVCLNLSCPNTRDGQGFVQQPQRLKRLLEALAEVGVEKPLLLKVAPFTTPAELDGFLGVAAATEFVSGFSVNLPPGKPKGLERLTMPGAVSGRPAAREADRTIEELYRAIDPSRHVIVGSGGVFTAADAYRKIRLGASLVQLLTALVYRGPGVVREINRELPVLLAGDGFKRVADAVGADVRA